MDRCVGRLHLPYSGASCAVVRARFFLSFAPGPIHRSAQAPTPLRGVRTPPPRFSPLGSCALHRLRGENSTGDPCVRPRPGRSQGDRHEPTPSIVCNHWDFASSGPEAGLEPAHSGGWGRRQPGSAGHPCPAMSASGHAVSPVSSTARRQISWAITLAALRALNWPATLSADGKTAPIRKPLYVHHPYKRMPKSASFSRSISACRARSKASGTSVGRGSRARS